MTDTNPNSAPSGMLTSPAGRSNIATWEGRRKNAYQDSAGNWTIGVGHKIVPGDGLAPNSATTITDQTIDALFADDIEEAETSVKSRVTVPLSQGQFDALVDFAFQFGDGKFGSSTLLRLLNSGDYAGAQAEFAKWIHVNNVPNQQLIARRNADAIMFA